MIIYVVLEIWILTQLNDPDLLIFLLLRLFLL